MIFDSHIHTKISFDSEMNLETAMAAAAERGIGMVLTEHIDFDFPGGGYEFSPPDYFRQYEAYRSESLLLGVEIGMHEDALERNTGIVEGQAFDCVIGSIHVLEGQDLYEPSFYENRSKTEVYEEYFRVMAECIRRHPFIDVLGHIDYIARYAPYKEPEVYYHEFTEPIRAVLEAALATGTVLELNTRRLASRSVLKSLLPLYKAYAECGGRFATIGSDAHVPEAIGRDFAAGCELLEACGLKPVYFKQRQPEYM